jgi:hypothetical protein
VHTREAETETGSISDENFAIPRGGNFASGGFDAAVRLVLAPWLGLIAGPATAQSFDGKWSGTLRCDALSFTIGPLRVPLEMTVSGGRASYEREVLNAQGSAVVGTEEGTGTVDHDGNIVLSAVWKSAAQVGRISYTARYAGRLSSTSGSLNGTQVFTVDGKVENRPCTIALMR